MRDIGQLYYLIEKNEKQFRRNRIKRFCVTTLIITVIFFALACIGGSVTISRPANFYIDYDGTLRFYEPTVWEKLSPVVDVAFPLLCCLGMSAIYVWSGMLIFSRLLKKTEKEKAYLESLKAEMSALEKEVLNNGI